MEITLLKLLLNIYILRGLTKSSLYIKRMPKVIYCIFYIQNTYNLTNLSLFLKHMK